MRLSLLPKGNFTWVLLLVLLYILATSEKDLSSIVSKEEIEAHEIKVKSNNSGAKFLEKPAETIVNKINETPTGKVILKALMEQAMQKQYSKKDIAIISAKQTGQIQTIDILKGTGKQTHCGSTVTIHYNGFISEHVNFINTEDSAKPLTFTLGKGKQLKGLEQGIVDMHVGGSRRIVIPPSLAYDDPRFQNDTVPANQVVTFEVKLLETQDDLYPPSNKILFMDDTASDSSVKVLCGSNVTFNYSLADATGKALVGGKTTSITATMGKHSLPIGLEQGLMNMTLNGKRKIVVPPEFHLIPDTSILPNAFNLPKETVVFDVVIQVID